MRKNRISGVPLQTSKPLVTKGINVTSIAESENTTEQLILNSISERTTAEGNLQVGLEQPAMKNKKTKGRKEEPVSFQRFFAKTPCILCILKGPQHVYEMVNPLYEQFINNRECIGKTVREVHPEQADDNFCEPLDMVYATGKTFTSKETPVVLDKGDGIAGQCYFTFTYQAYFNLNNETEGILVYGNEVTAQVTALKKSETKAAMINNLYMNAPEFLCTLIGPEHVYDLINPAYQKLFGLHELSGKPILKALPELKKQGIGKVLDTVYTTGEATVGLETPIWLPDENAKPNLRYFNFSYQPIYDDNKKTNGVLVFGYEVTKDVKEKSELKESVERFRMLADAMPQKVWSADSTGKFNYFNHQWLDYTHRTFDELQDFGWIEVMHPYDRDSYKKAWQHSIETGENLQIEQRLLQYDGNYRWHLSRGTAQKDKKGKIISWVGTNTDIHEQKTNSQEKFLFEFADEFLLFDTGADFFKTLVKYIAKKTGMDYVYVAHLAEEETELRHLKTIAFLAHGKVVPDFEYPLINSPCWQVIRGTIASFAKGCQQLFSKSQLIPQYNIEGYIGYPLRNSDGKTIGVMAVMNEKEITNTVYISSLLKIITRRAEFELERNEHKALLNKVNLNLKISIDELHKTNFQLNQFSYTVSHDLQVPLRKIKTYSTRLNEKYKDALPAEAGSWLDKIENSSERMGILIESLLTYAHLGHSAISFEQTDLDNIFKNILSDFELVIEEKKAAINKMTLPVIQAVPSQMNQLFYNMLSNALKFIKPGVAPVIDIVVKAPAAVEIKKHPALNPDKTYTEIVIKDNGIGLDIKYADKIFEAFHRLYTKEVFDGSGIGLAIVKKIIENHNGAIWVDSKENEGAAFHVMLPVS